MATLYGNEVETKYPHHGQVYQVTHGEGGKRLPFMYRSFISFSFGGKVIEDYGLIAYTEGESLDRPSMANFEDITENYEVADGQIYWGSHFNEYELELNLVTDGITERQLDDFKHWFRPGATRELVLAEHPNRAIMARLAEPPELSFLPFEKQSSIKVAGVERETSITEYKGTARIKFVAEEPYWYARYNLFLPYEYGEGVFGIIPVDADINYIFELVESNLIYARLLMNYTRNSKDYEQVLRILGISKKDAYWRLTVQEDGASSSFTLTYPTEIKSIKGGVVLLDEKDYLKAMIEDNIPHIAMLKTDCIFGNSLVIEDNVFDEDKVYNDTASTVNSMLPYTGAHVDSSWIWFSHAKILSQVNVNKGSAYSLYYPGSAPTRPALTFTFTPHFDSNGRYIVEPYNKTYANSSDYSYLAIDDNRFYFTTPAILTGYNQAVNIVYNFSSGEDYASLLTAIKEGVHEYYARAWAIACLQALKSSTSYVTAAGAIVNISTFGAQFLSRMKYFISNGSSCYPVTVKFDCKTGETTGTFTVRTIPSSTTINSSTNFSSFSGYVLEENVGDMVKSDYLIIDGRDYPNSEGFITNVECHKVTTNYSSGLQNLNIAYKVLYY